ncbi:MAG: hypothetical protein LC772_13090, partial [Chloroflexi bacterium]|nr:hypothetical protein [Chloroflexota bacterium]
LTSAMNDGDQDRFHEVLATIIRLVQQSGHRTPDDAIVPSEVIVPPEGITLAEAHRFLTDEGLMQPIPA